MAQPGDGAAGCEHLRASHADRERVIGMLETAFVAGLLSKDERDLGVDRALAARTYAELAAVTAGLRTQSAPTPPPGRSARPLTRLENAAAWGVCGLIMTAVLTIVIVPSGTTLGMAVITAGLTCAVFWPLAGIMMLAARHGWRQLPARHGPHDQVRFGAADHGVRQRRLGRFVG
jgi:Domain of unknown function (DUF1707)